VAEAFCGNCGASVPQNARSCSHCGVTLGGISSLSSDQLRKFRAETREYRYRLSAGIALSFVPHLWHQLTKDIQIPDWWLFLNNRRVNWSDVSDDFRYGSRLASKSFVRRLVKVYEGAEWGKGGPAYDTLDAICRARAFKTPDAILPLVRALSYVPGQTYPCSFARLLALAGYNPTDLDTRISYYSASLDIDALAALGAPAVEALIACTSGGHLNNRVRAAEALGKIGDRRAIDPLIKIVPDFISNKPWHEYSEEEIVRAVAIIGALGSIGDAQAEQFLSSLLNDQLKYDRTKRLNVAVTAAIENIKRRSMT
jgi:hypothetical protein